MQLPAGMKVVFEAKTDHIRELVLVLQKAGLKTATGPSPGDGWGTKAWLAVASADTEKARAAYEAHMEAMVRREGLRVSNDVVDFDAEETACPACGHKFKTAGTTKCPDCGIAFG